MGQEFGSGPAGCLWLRMSHEIRVKVSAGSTGPKDPLPRWLTHKAMDRRSQFLTHGLLHRAV